MFFLADNFIAIIGGFFILVLISCTTTQIVNKPIESNNNAFIINSMANRNQYAIIKKIDTKTAGIHSGSFVVTAGKHSLVTSCSHLESEYINELLLNVVLIKGHTYKLMSIIDTYGPDKSDKKCLTVLKDITAIPPANHK